MSRRIEYRVWDNENETYNSPYQNVYYAMTQDGELGLYFHGDYIDDCEPDRYIIEQDTGLKDKNGEKIYEGDIVLDYYDGEDAFIVERDKDTASFILTGTDNIASVSFDNFYSDKDLEIVGNVHKNPELLGGEE